jgi:NAD(P)-dependent dehydrogenase (short-subunit alcohol dehydrogenase family)
MMAAPQATRASGTKSNQIAFVTGGQQGIGKEIARKLAIAGVTTILGCQDNDLGSKVSQELQEAGGDVVFTQLELCDNATILAARDLISEKFGRLDILINNAAICFNDPTLYGKCDYTPFEKQAGITIATNFFGTLDVTRAMLPLMRSSPSPRIVTVASNAGRLAILRSQDKVAAFTSPSLKVDQIEQYMRQFVEDVESGVHASQGWPNTCYGVSKLGLIALTRVLARDEPQLMINCVDPGYCATAQNAFQGQDTPEEGARAATFLALLPDDKKVSGKYYTNSFRPSEEISEKKW